MPINTPLQKPETNNPSLEKFPRILWRQKLSYRLHKIPYPEPHQSLPHPQINFNDTLTSVPRYSKWPHFPQVPPSNPVCTFPFPIVLPALPVSPFTSPPHSVSWGPVQSCCEQNGIAAGQQWTVGCEQNGIAAGQQWTWGFEHMKCPGKYTQNNELWPANDLRHFTASIFKVIIYRIWTDPMDIQIFH